MLRSATNYYACGIFKRPGAVSNAWTYSITMLTNNCNVILSQFGRTFSCGSSFGFAQCINVVQNVLGQAKPVVIKTEYDVKSRGRPLQQKKKN